MYDETELVCPICDIFEARYIPPQPARHDEPAHPGFWECVHCGSAINASDPWERRVEKAEAAWDDLRGH